MGHISTLLCQSHTSTVCKGRMEVCQSSAAMMELLATLSKLLRTMETDKTSSS